MDAFAALAGGKLGTTGRPPIGRDCVATATRGTLSIFTPALGMRGLRTTCLWMPLACGQLPPVDNRRHVGGGW
jgi:hypothetical protein